MFEQSILKFSEFQQTLNEEIRSLPVPMGTIGYRVLIGGVWDPNYELWSETEWLLITTSGEMIDAQGFKSVGGGMYARSPMSLDMIEWFRARERDTQTLEQLRPGAIVTVRKGVITED